MRKLVFPLPQRGLALLLALLLVYTTSGIPLAQSQTTRLPYSGETVFRGILLGDDPVAKLFPEIWESPNIAAHVQRAQEEKSTEEIAAEKQKIVDLLRAQDPTFFDRFGIEMQSGDRIRIQQALTEAGTRLKQELGKMQSSRDLRPVFVIVVVAVAVAAVVALVVVADGFNDGKTTNPGLQRDVWVDLIAQRLHPASSG
jgi:SdpC family antimicrobial peptide